jgi:hypothetical protein
MTRTSKLLCGLCFFTVLFSATLTLNATVTHKLLISEFMALNKSVLADVDGEYSDWVELYNPGETTVDLTGWYLTDNASFLSKWTFPTATIGAGQYLLIWASGKDKVTSTGEIHTNFKLSGTGEYLALVEPDTMNIAYEYAPNFPAQQTDISYGIYLGQQTYFKDPTPGAGNSIGSQILTPVFSVTRGFFTDPFTVNLSVADATATIRYTTDGIRPTATVGKLYTGPLTLSKTTPLSAVCVKDGTVSPVVTNTYFFLSDIVNQSNTPTGYPTGWGTLQYNLSNSGYSAGERAPADYEMDPDICNSTTYKTLIDDALTSIPTVSIVTNPGYLFSYSIDPDTGGIYIYTGDVAKDSYNTSNTKLGTDWERPASVEYFDPSDSSQFQINCALLLHGGNGRKSYNTPKHSFRFSFRSEYGASKLNFNLFSEKKATDRFDHIIARAAMNYSWLHNAELQRTNAQNLTDAFSRKLQLDMGQVSGHDKFAHVYLNGLYWGVFDLTEKFNNDFMESYFGGEDTQYDVVNDDGAVDGDLSTYTTMSNNALAGKYSTLVSNNQLDCANFIDYMLMNFYIGNIDWDKNNWFAGRNSVTPEKGYRYFSWDAENSMAALTDNRVTLYDGTPTKMFKALAADTEFKVLLADRIQKHFFNGGALTAENTIYRYGQMAGRIDTAMIAESARWGDYRKDIAKETGAALYTLNDHWLARRDYLINTYFPSRTTTVYNQLSAAGYVSTVAAPTYNSRGGELLQPFDLTISAAAGTIYYTTDGSDPRLSGGSVSTEALTYSKALRVIGNGTVKARAKSGSAWSAVNEVSFEHADTVHFIDDGSGLPVNGMQQPIDIFYASNSLHYQLPAEGNVSLTIFTLDGRPTGQHILGAQAAGSHHIDRLNLPTGIYLYRMQFNQEILTGKLVVQ